MVDLVDLDMTDVDIILGMDWIHSYYATLDCRTKKVTYPFPNKIVIE